MRTMIHPGFTPDDLAANALELCDLFLLRRAARRKPAPAHFEQRAGFFYFRPNHFAAFGRRCGQPGQQQGRRSPARSRSPSWRK